MATADLLYFCELPTTTGLAQCLTSLYKPQLDLGFHLELDVTTEEKTIPFVCL